MNGNQTSGRQDGRLARMRGGHLREHVLAGAALQLLNGELPALNASSQTHLARCERCAARVDELRAVLAGERQDVADAADTLISDARLDAQRTTILDRLARARAGARVLAFPTAQSWSRSWTRRDRPAMRWLAAAAAAGLVIGLGAGRLDITRTPRFAAVTAMRDWTPRWTNAAPETRASEEVRDEMRLERVSHITEEDFLSEMESALNSRKVAPLRALDDLTPRPLDTGRLPR